MYSYQLKPKFTATRYRWPETFRFRHVLPGSPFEIKPEHATASCPAGTYLRIGARTAKACKVDFIGRPHVGPEPGVIYPPAALPVNSSPLPSI
jgi:hypothetical protein